VTVAKAAGVAASASSPTRPAPEGGLIARIPPSLPPHEFLAAHLENIGMTATEWGKLIGIDRSTASRLLRGERKFNTGHVRKTAEVLNLEASLLI
jgi:antitoxin component HigA of HigAB toxin-antitoxin module